MAVQKSQAQDLKQSSTMNAPKKLTRKIYFSLVMNMIETTFSEKTPQMSDKSQFHPHINQMMIDTSNSLLKYLED